MMRACVRGAVTGRIAGANLAETQEGPANAQAISDLRKEFESLKGFLGDAEERQEGDEVVRKWMSGIKDLAFEVEEITDMHLDRIARHRRIQPGAWNAIKAFPRALHDDIVLGLEDIQINSLTKQISRMTSNMKAYGIEYREAESTSTSTADDPSIMDAGDNCLLINRTLIGLDEDVKTIENQLISTGGARVVGICGVHGLGKTTLAEVVLHSKRVRPQFQATCWACVGQDESRVKAVLQKIAQRLLGNSNINSEEEEDILSEKIRQILIQKRCLVVLDDIQTPATWDRLRAAFSSIHSSSTSKLVLTTCDPDVLTHVDRQGFLHQLRFLNRQEKWKLFLNGAEARKGEFGPYKTSRWKSVINRCVGLPLTILVLGGLAKSYGLPSLKLSRGLQRRHSTFPRNHILRRMAALNDHDQSIVELEVELVLCLSHITLKFEPWVCLMEMLDYPVGLWIPTEELFDRWIGSGTGAFKGMRPSSASAKRFAQKCLDCLKDRSLIQAVANKTGEYCQLQGVVRDFFIRLPSDFHYPSWSDIGNGLGLVKL